MSGISEERLVKIDEEWLDTAQEVAEEAKNLGVQQASDRIILLAVAEIRRLRAVIKAKNHCVECGNLNPVDNVCDGCWQQMDDR